MKEDYIFWSKYINHEGLSHQGIYLDQEKQSSQVFDALSLKRPWLANNLPIGSIVMFIHSQIFFSFFQIAEKKGQV